MLMMRGRAGSLQGNTPPRQNAIINGGRGAMQAPPEESKPPQRSVGVNGAEPKGVLVQPRAEASGGRGGVQAP